MLAHAFGLLSPLTTINYRRHFYLLLPAFHCATAPVNVESKIRYAVVAHISIYACMRMAVVAALPEHTGMLVDLAYRCMFMLAIALVVARRFRCLPKREI